MKKLLNGAVNLQTRHDIGNLTPGTGCQGILNPWAWNYRTHKLVIFGISLWTSHIQEKRDRCRCPGRQKV